MGGDGSSPAPLIVIYAHWNFWAFSLVLRNIHGKEYLELFSHCISVGYPPCIIILLQNPGVWLLDLGVDIVLLLLLLLLFDRITSVCIIHMIRDTNS